MCNLYSIGTTPSWRVTCITVRPELRVYSFGSDQGIWETTMHNTIRELTIDELATVSGGSDSTLRMQMLTDRRSKAFETLSNAMKKMSDTSRQIVANLK